MTSGQVWVEKRRRSGVIVECPLVKEGQVCVRLNGKRAAHRHYRTESVEVQP